MESHGGPDPSVLWCSKSAEFDAAANADDDPRGGGSNNSLNSNELNEDDAGVNDRETRADAMNVDDTPIATFHEKHVSNMIEALSGMPTVPDPPGCQYVLIALQHLIETRQKALQEPSNDLHAARLLLQVKKDDDDDDGDGDGVGDGDGDGDDGHGGPYSDVVFLIFRA